jgi:hypothetical protein
VDRRFNRRRYDAARTVEAFDGRLRERVDLDTFSAELLAVVDQTMEPTTASLWRRPRPKARRVRSFTRTSALRDRVGVRCRCVWVGLGGE